MENASKALLIAGGLLIALITITVLIRTFTTVSSFQSAKLSEEEQENIIAFNQRYTKYAGQYVYGTEVLTLINRYSDDEKVKVFIDDALINSGTYDTYCKDTKYYKCTGVEYNTETGMVNKIKFIQIQIPSIAET